VNLIGGSRNLGRKKESLKSKNGLKILLLIEYFLII
jgi:hypothetical protein